MCKGEMLRIKRALLNVTQAEMAKELFCSRQTIIRMETGERIDKKNFNLYNRALNEKLENHQNRSVFKLIVELLERA